MSISGNKNSESVKTPRKDVMKWWNNSENNKNDCFRKWTFSRQYFNKHWLSLTVREIEIIYNLEFNTL